MIRSALVFWVTCAGLVLTGCAAPTRTPAVTGLPGITECYEQATATHHRAVRKPARDQRALALRQLAKQADTLLAEAQTWDSDARLVALAEPDRPAAREAVADFRAALGDLRTAASKSDLRAVRAEYARVQTSYRHLSETVGPLD